VRLTIHINVQLKLRVSGAMQPLYYILIACAGKLYLALYLTQWYHLNNGSMDDREFINLLMEELQ